MITVRHGIFSVKCVVKAVRQNMKAEGFVTENWRSTNQAFAGLVPISGSLIGIFYQHGSEPAPAPKDVLKPCFHM